MSDIIPTKVSVTAEAVYPHLVKPDVRFNELGEYKVTLKVAKQDASEMVKEIEKSIEDSLAKAEKENKGKSVKSAPKPYKEESDHVFFKFKMKASGTNSKTKEKFTQRPTLFDAKKRPITNGTVIWGGSKMKVAYQLVPYYVPAIGAGVSARLKACQILKLVEGKDSASSHLFKEEEGYETSTPNNLSETKSNETEVQTSTDF